MPSDPSPSRAADSATTALIVGVDTHKHTHVAVAITRLGARLAAHSAPATREGYAALLGWARRLGEVEAFAVEGTGSYGAGLASFLRRQAIHVVEVSHCDRRKRRKDGKNDTLDAENAARSVLAGTATAVPKTADGTAEMVRQLKIARDTAVKARSAAIIALKTLLVNAPGELRETLEPLSDRLLLARCAQLSVGAMHTPAAAVRHALRALALRWRVLTDEIATHDALLDTLTAAAVPTLRAAFGIGPDAAAEMLIVAGDNPARIRSDAAFAKLCGACPIPASSGITHRHRIFRGGHRHANAALYRIVIVRLRWHQPTIDYVARRTAQGLSKKDIIRCLKRFVAREVYRALLADHAAREAAVEPALVAA
ncbi:MAG TPA: IS110 family transposase [Nocardioidaceae bacterium]